ncbi:LAGLIDADG family homing endonuclease [Candidatus Nomurabacteria bacterium]|nr:LAGLIDADG family homing endonuclease [Candidatus Nomurabacteria bacterium]
MTRHNLPLKQYKWTPDLAYIVGLIATDGCLSPDGRHLTFTSCDLKLIETFKKCLKLNNKIGTTDTKALKIQFGDIQFYKWLLSIGLTPAKSHTIREIKIPKEFFRDFIRGHLDGDGSITVFLDKHNTYKNSKYIYRRLFVRLLSASKEHIMWLQKNIIENFGVTGRIHKTKVYEPSKVPLYILKFMKKESQIFLKQIYYKKSLPCLERKRLIASEFL